MGFWSRLSKRVLGTKEREARTPIPTPKPQLRPRMELTDIKSFDMGQRFEQIFDAIKAGNVNVLGVVRDQNNIIMERLDFMIAEHRKLKDRFETMETQRRRIKTKEILKTIEKNQEITLFDLAKDLKTRPNLLHYHLNKLIEDGKIVKVEEGLYKINEKIKKPENALKYLFP